MGKELKNAVIFMDSADFGIENLDSFKNFFKGFYPSLAIFANKYLQDQDASHDIVQDAFVRIWNKRESITCENAAKDYLYKYVRCKSLNYLRDQKLRKRHHLKIESQIFFRDNLIEEEIYEKIYAAVQNLPPQGQRVIDLSLDGFKNQEIAELLNISINTVKTIKLRAFQSMRSELKTNIFTFFFLPKSK